MLSYKGNEIIVRLLWIPFECIRSFGCIAVAAAAIGAAVSVGFDAPFAFAFAGGVS